MSAAHTPGPWFYEVNRDAVVGLTDAPVISIRTRAKGFEDDSSICGIHVMDKRSGADGRLIAAAPELLEELKYLVEVAESAMRAANRDGGEYDIGEMLQAPLAAIAKATGDQQ